MGIDEVFKILSKGVMVSINSKKYSEVAKFLLIDDNQQELATILNRLGFNLKGENGYFFIAQKDRLSDNQLNSFLNNHKTLIISIAILKQLFPFLDTNDILKQTDFITKYNQKNDPLLKEKFEYIFQTKDLKNITEEFFYLLERYFIIEKISSDTSDDYRILNSIKYYINIVESVV
jgi:hypothetical protein